MASSGRTGGGIRGTLAGRRGSLTAAKIARGVVLVAQDPLHARLLPTDVAETTRDLALASRILQPWMVSLFGSPRYRRAVEWTIDRFSPGELLRLTIRKRYVDDRVKECVAGGTRQFLILGPGFDTLGPRIARECPDLIFTFMNLDAHGRPFIGHASGLSRLTLRMIGEGLHWGLPHGGLEDFLQANQFRLIDAPEPDVLAHRYLEPLGEAARPVGGLERMAHAKW